MTANPVECQHVVDESLAEQYVAGQLDDDVRDAFELHYMGCAACFERVAVLHEVRARLSAELTTGLALPAVGAARWVGRRVWLATAGLAASLMIGMWVVPRRASAPVGTAAVSPAAAVAEPSFGPVAAAPVDPLAALASFEPPAYRASVLRGREDEAAVQFRAAMAFYQQGRFADAVPGLSRAATSREDAAFFLAACRLLTGDAPRAAEAARQAVAFGDTSYREEAQLLLAKALLRLHDRDAALRELEGVAAMEGEHRREAADLLARLASLP